MLFVTLMTSILASSGWNDTPWIIESDWIRPVPTIAPSYGSSMLTLSPTWNTSRYVGVYINIRKKIQLNSKNMHNYWYNKIKCTHDRVNIWNTSNRSCTHWSRMMRCINVWRSFNFILHVITSCTNQIYHYKDNNIVEK